MKILKDTKRFLSLNNQWLIILFVIFLPRIFYIIFTNNITNDSLFYLDIANNITKGCGFSYTNQIGECEPLFGGYFPGYPLFLYFLKLVGIGNKFNIIIVSILTSLSLLYLISTLKDFGLKQKYIYIVVLFIGLSPLSIGYSRFLLIDPIIYLFSILLLTEFIKLSKNPTNFDVIYPKLILISILSIFFKPISFFLIIPHFILILVSFGIKKFIKFSIIYILFLSLSIIPWGLRDLEYGAKIPFKVDSNVSPTNIKGLVNWLATFSLTEIDHASSLYPIYNRDYGDRKDVKIRTKLNPFISKNDKDYKEVLQILNKQNPEIKRGFTDIEESRLNELAKIRSSKNGLIGNFLLYTIKFIAILIHPFNSWGWPISVTLNAKYSLYNFSLNYKIILKLILFLYRLVLFYFYFRNIFSFLKSIKFKRLFSDYNHLIVKDNLILIGSFSLLLINLYLYIVLFGFIEHRYLYPIIPWLEFSVISNFIDSKISNIKLEEKS